MKIRFVPLWGLICLALGLGLAFSNWPAVAKTGNPGVYTLDADFAEGTLVNVNYTDVPDQLQLDSQAMPFEFIWIAASGRGTIVKIDTVTGNVLGEYWSSPNGRGRNPSRTTVDGDGNLWATNRNESENNTGSVVKIGLVENGQCEDRDNDGVIETSTGLGDIKDWLNGGGVDNNGGVSTAEDECILLYVRLPNAPNARHVAVDSNNNVWVGGYYVNPQTFHQLDGQTGAILDTINPSCGGYGGFIDGNGVMWSADIWRGYLLRYDLAARTETCLRVGASYGLGLDSLGNVWNALYSSTIDKRDPTGTLLGKYATGGALGRGVVATADNNIWIANSNSNDVTRLDNAGTLLAAIPVGNTPTGVAVDAAGKVWAANLSSNNVSRIDPTTNTVDLTVNLGAGASPYNYSDMTGSTLIAPPENGAWTIVHDSSVIDAKWGYVKWTADTPSDSTFKVYAASSTDGVTFSAEEEVANGVDLTVPDGQYLQVRVEFTRASTGESPILYDLTILANRPPDCSQAYPSQSKLWPPNHQFVPIDILGVTDPDGDPVTITISAIWQDEPVDTYGDGKFTPDGKGVGTSTAEVRAERAGTQKVPGNGRVYYLYYTATDQYGYTCELANPKVLVEVPHDQNKPAIDDGPKYDSTALQP